MLLPQASQIHSFFSSFGTFSLVALSSVFFLVDPFAAIPAFLAMTANHEATEQTPDGEACRLDVLRSAVGVCSFGRADLPHVRHHAGSF